MRKIALALTTLAFMAAAISAAYGCPSGWHNYCYPTTPGRSVCTCVPN